MDRRRIMILSDLVRAPWRLDSSTRSLAATRTAIFAQLLLMFASPFFTSGRSSILPTIANSDELHAANSLTQITQWTTITIGSFLAELPSRPSAIDCIRLQRGVVLVFGLVYFATGASGGFHPRRTEPENERPSRNRKSSVRGTNIKKDCATCARRR